MVALNTAYAAPKNAADPKNRVGDFFYEDHASVGKNHWAKRLNAQEKSSYHYETASGRSNWPNRDPIEEIGGLNVYTMIGNDAVNHWDLLGLKCTVTSGPTPKSGAKWELERLDFNGIAATFAAQLTGLESSWELEGEVECCCKGLFGSKNKTKKVTKTFKKSASFEVVQLWPMLLLICQAAFHLLQVWLVLLVKQLLVRFLVHFLLRLYRVRMLRLFAVRSIEQSLKIQV